MIMGRMHEQVGSVKIDQKLVGYLENGSGFRQIS